MPRNVGGAASGGLNLQTPSRGAGSADLGRILLLGEGDWECSLHWLLPHAPFLSPVLYHPIWDFFHPKYPLGCPSGSAGKESSCNVGDLALIPELGKSTGEGNGYLLRYSGLENYSSWGVSYPIPVPSSLNHQGHQTKDSLRNTAEEPRETESWGATWHPG